VHVGLVLPGFIVTEGFPQRELRNRAVTRLMLSTPEKVAEAIVDAGPGGKAERFIPRPYWFASAMRAVAPRLTRRVLGGSGESMTPATGADPEKDFPRHSLEDPSAVWEDSRVHRSLRSFPHWGVEKSAVSPDPLGGRRTCPFTQPVFPPRRPRPRE
jgi:hypothetical protein